MPTAAVDMLRQALAGNVPGGNGLLWADLFAAMASIIPSAPTPEVESVLLDILRFDAELPLVPDAEMPHSMAPEEMLKSLALQALGRWTGLTYLRLMQRVQATASSPALAATAKAVIHQAQRATRAEREWEDIEEVFSIPQGAMGRRHLPRIRW